MSGRRARRYRKIILAGFMKQCQELNVNPSLHEPISRKTLLSARRHGTLSPQSQRFDEAVERARASRHKNAHRRAYARRLIGASRREAAKPETREWAVKTITKLEGAA